MKRYIYIYITSIMCKRTRVFKVVNKTTSVLYSVYVWTRRRAPRRRLRGTFVVRANSRRARPFRFWMRRRKGLVADYRRFYRINRCVRVRIIHDTLAIALSKHSLHYAHWALPYKSNRTDCSFVSDISLSLRPTLRQSRYRGIRFGPSTVGSKVRYLFKKYIKLRYIYIYKI